MEKMRLGNSGLEVSNISLGCMNMGKESVEKTEKIVRQALELGVDFFDHADIYAGGQSEETFAKAIDMKSSIRENVYLQTKVGIRKGFYDFSKEHILKSVEDSLHRLHTDYVDVLLLHRPDTLVEPEEVAEAFDQLYTSGKVRHFGVSNHHPRQIELLKKNVDQELIINQLQFSVMHTGMINRGLQVNTRSGSGLDRDGGVLEYSRLHDMTIQAWSPFRYGMFEGFYIDNEEFPELNEKLQEIGEKYGVNKSAAAIAWILRHPAGIQPVVGTMTPERLKKIVAASELKITRQEWYEIYRAAGNELP
ncbi:aldo/keto reductase family oxidoreductase [Virgibacillus xinjiangensis]|uniref:Aldo/keto reductase family oxidoreductase n=1 Tax=Virgibacillus xinjiangensis TaxID=393090 RepID=A0ABV7CQG7_9BACI